MKASTTITAVLIAALFVTAAGASETVTPIAPGFTEVECPAGPGASGPFLYKTPGGGRVTLSWVEPSGDGHRLRFATWEDSAWGEARTVAEGSDWFVNWADVPSVIASDDGRMAAHWLQKSGPDTYAYDVRVSLSFDNGKTWSEAITPHSDGTQTEHGFASLLFDDDYLHLVWLDGRKHADENAPDEMTLRAARIDRVGKISGEVELDGRTCDCCPTAIAAIDGGFIVAYRDRSPDEIRDIYTVRYIDGAWEEPRLVHADNWKINGCPVNGPAMASNGWHIAMAWFTMDGDRAVVRGAWSGDNGKTLGGVRDMKTRNPLGRVAMAGMEGGSPSAEVAWLSTTENGAVIACRWMNGFGIQENAREIAYTSAARSSGYPRIATLPGDRLLAVWTESGSRLRSAVHKLDGSYYKVSKPK